MYVSQVVAFAATFSTTIAVVYQGFNYGAQLPNGEVKRQSDFEAEFKTARSLVGAPGNGFTSARLFTMRVSEQCSLS